MPHQTLLHRLACVALAAGAISPAFAEFQLISHGYTSDGYEAVLEYQARAPQANEPTTVYLEDENAEGGVLELTIDGTGIDSASESALLAVQGDFDASEWRIEAALDGGAAVDWHEAVTLKPVTLGAVRGVQVMVNPEKGLDATGSPARIEGMTITVRGPRATTRRSQQAPIEEHPDFQRIVRNTFLNGDSVAEIPKSDGRRVRRAAPANPGEFRITYEEGDEIISVPLASIGATAGDLAQIGIAHHDDVLPIGGIVNDEIWFYAPRNHTLNDRSDSVFASVGATTVSLSMATRPAFLTLAPEGNEVSVPRSRLYEEQNVYERFALYPVQTKFFWHFARYPASGSFASTYTHALEFFDELTSLDVDFTAKLYSHNSNVSFNPDHYADVEVGGVAVPRASWEGRTIYNLAGTVTLASQPAGSISFKHTVPSGTPPTALGADWQLLDSVELRWNGYPRIDDENKATLSLNGSESPRRVTIGGLPELVDADDVLLLDITNPVSPIRIQLSNSDLFTTNGLTAVEFEAEATTSTFHLQLLTSVPSIEAVPAETLPSAPPEELKGIYVRPPVFAEVIEPLVSMRGVNNIVELDPQAAYNAFSGGQESPEAIRRAIQEIILSASSASPLPWVVLIGHASLDPRDYLGLITAPQVPTFIEPSVFVIQSSGFMENAVDYPYALLWGDDSLPDAMVARIPARTVADVELAVERAVLHEAASETLAQNDRPGLFIASSGTDSSFFIADQPVLSGLYEASGNSSHIILESNYTANVAGWAAMHSDIVSSMTLEPAGLGLVMYTGHGFNDQWNRPQYMESAKVPAIDTEGKWPVVATFTCLNGYFAFPGNSILTLGEAWMFSTATGTVRGAIANMAPAGVDYYPSQREFAISVLEPLGLDSDSRPRTVGELMVMAQTNFAAENPGLATTLHEVLLFGDPASSLALQVPFNTGVHGWLLLEE